MFWSEQLSTFVVSKCLACRRMRATRVLTAVRLRHMDNTWEPATHFEQCPEILQQFHQRKGLRMTS